MTQQPPRLDLIHLGLPVVRQAQRLLGCWLGLSLSLACSSDDDEALQSTYASWAASPQDYAEELPFPNAPAPEPTSFDDQTLRQIVHTSAGGEALRVQVSNLFGDAPVSIDAAGIALSQGGGSIDVAHAKDFPFIPRRVRRVPNRRVFLEVAGLHRPQVQAVVAGVEEEEIRVAVLVGVT